MSFRLAPPISCNISILRGNFTKFALLLLGLLCVGSLRAGDEISYGRDIRPILSDKCFFCHGTDPETREGDLRLDIRKDALAGKAFVPGNPGESLLIERINSTDEDKLMPPAKSHKSLSAKEKQLLHDWIKAGADYEPHWAYTAPQRKAGETIDSLVADSLKENQLAFSAPAEPSTLLRRLHFDITGLPPTPAGVDAFRQAYARDAQAAVGRVVDQLLASPHFGERMAVSWLDSVRYADSVGYHGDQERSASPYRDYVIGAFNADMPFDQFTVEQIAGDLLPNATLSQKIAASYNRLNQISVEGGIQDAEYVAKYQAERVRTTTSAWLGSTMACCECHDHKFDPFTAKDFYSFAAYFSDILEKGAWNGSGKYQEPIDPWTKKGIKFDRYGPYHEVPTAEQARQLADVDGRLEATRARAGDDKALAKIIKGLETERAGVMKSVATVPATISAKPRTVRLLNRGDWQDKTGQVVSPAPPGFLAGESKTQHQTRLDLARWLVDKKNPLTARVFVNRLWARLFGTGLSKNTGDLGYQGEYPSHPQLIDWLALEFMENNWSVKHLVKTMVLSRTYQQSSTPTAELSRKDPDNRRLRLPAELIRDNALSLSGLLTATVGGPSAKPYQPAGYYQHLNFPRRKYQTDTGALLYRRGLYTHWQRTFLHPMLKNFDAPSRDECATERPGSNTPLQALNLLNDPTFTEAARALATRLLTGAADDSQLVERAYRHCLSRPPTAKESAILARFHRQELERFTADPGAANEFLSIGASAPTKDIPPVRLAAAASLARVILNLHETITRY